MQIAPQYDHEEERERLINESGLALTTSNPLFDELTTKAVDLLKVKVSTVSLIHNNSEIFIGSCGLDKRSGPRDISFCSHALVSQEALICEDTSNDPRFHDNPYVVGPPYTRFYAGMKLLDRKSGHPIAVFCVKDPTPRKLSTAELATFFELAEEAEDILNAQIGSKDN